MELYVKHIHFNYYPCEATLIFEDGEKGYINKNKIVIKDKTYFKEDVYGYACISKKLVIIYLKDNEELVLKNHWFNSFIFLGDLSTVLKEVLE